MERAERDPEFRRGLLLEAVNCLLEGEFAPAMIILRDYVNATVGFRRLAEETNHSPKSLMRMLSPTGNPRSNNLLEVIRILQEHEGIRLEVTAVEGAEELQDEDEEHEGAEIEEPTAAVR